MATNYEDSRLIFKAMKQVVETIINSNGEVYGGYVRDMIRHDYYATMFYEQNTLVNLTPGEIQDKYDDPAVFPEAVDRLLIPKDIDCFFKSQEDFTKFLQHLESASFIIQDQEQIQFSSYDNGGTLLRSGNISHFKLEVTFASAISTLYSQLPHNVAIDIVRQLRGDMERGGRGRGRGRGSHMSQPSIINIDVLVKNSNRDISPPFNTLDFECNSFKMTKGGRIEFMRLTKELGPYDYLCRFEKIKKDIINKVARVVNRKPARVTKMTEKGWLVA